MRRRPLLLGASLAGLIVLHRTLDARRETHADACGSCASASIAKARWNQSVGAGRLDLIFGSLQPSVEVILASALSGPIDTGERRLRTMAALDAVARLKEHARALPVDATEAVKRLAASDDPRVREAALRASSTIEPSSSLGEQPSATKFPSRADTPLPRGGGFTLVELIAVVAVVALLIAIAMPAFASARRAAQRTACLSNLKQQGLGLEAASSDRPERLLPFADRLVDVTAPPGMGFSREPVETIAAALETPLDAWSSTRPLQPPGVFVCPSNPQPASARGWSYFYQLADLFAAWPYRDPHGQVSRWVRSDPRTVVISDEGVWAHGKVNAGQGLTGMNLLHADGAVSEGSASSVLGPSRAPPIH